MSASENTPSRVHDLVGGVLGGFALAMLLTMRWQVDTTGPEPFYKGPLIFPLLVLSLMLAASLPCIWRLLKPAAGASWRFDGQGLPTLGLRIFSLLVIYLAGLIYIGLEISTWLFLFIALWLVDQKSPLKLWGIPTVVTLILYFVFKYFLDVWFPTPVLFELFME